MKIIYVTTSLPCGRGEAFIIPEIRTMAELGHEILVVPCYPRGEIVHVDSDFLLKVSLVKPLVSFEILRGAFSASKHHPRQATRALKALFRSRSLRILLKNLIVYLKGLWLVSIILDWEADHLHVHWLGVSSTMAMIAAEVSGIPWSITAHRWDIAENNLISQKSEKACFIRAISGQTAEILRTYVPAVAARPTVIHMGVTLPTHRSMPPRASPFGVFVPALFTEVKGHIYLVDAIKQLKDEGIFVQVDLLGSGPLQQTIFERIKKLGLEDRIQIQGLLPHHELLRSMQEGCWHVCVLPSIVTPDGVQEGIPVSLMEAMSFQIPVISTTTGGIPELLHDGAGIMVAPKDAAALANAIKLLMTDDSLRAQLAQAGRERIQACFSVGQSANDLIERFAICSDLP
ncbi:MAG: glycosyltransferase family 4 protein [Anaerolineae bacterium]|nr:glycosyltransferase family 4 protein [Anaerolineae bacterium]